MWGTKLNKKRNITHAKHNFENPGKVAKHTPKISHLQAKWSIQYILRKKTSLAEPWGIFNVHQERGSKLWVYMVGGKVNFEHLTFA
jgi:hypothetical protein